LYSTSNIKGCAALVPREAIAPFSTAIIPISWKGLAGSDFANGQLQIHTGATEQPSLVVKLRAGMDAKSSP
jgi:hypothetical protein